MGKFLVLFVLGILIWLVSTSYMIMSGAMVFKIIILCLAVGVAVGLVRKHR